MSLIFGFLISNPTMDPSVNRIEQIGQHFKSLWRYGAIGAGLVTQDPSPRKNKSAHKKSISAVSVILEVRKNSLESGTCHNNTHHPTMLNP